MFFINLGLLLLILVLIVLVASNVNKSSKEFNTPIYVLIILLLILVLYVSITYESAVTCRNGKTYHHVVTGHNKSTLSELKDSEGNSILCD